MAEMNGEQLMNEMDTFLNESASVQADAESALPFETINDYLGDPNEFGDVTAKLWKKVTAVFDLAVKYNRHSSDYLKSCAQLEKGIKYLGSSCLQKYALEQDKHVFPELGQLNTTNLYTMASIHFNKIDRALTEYMEQKQSVDDALLDMEYRFYHLMERIRATEVKIHNYDNKRYYGQEDYSPIVHGLAFSEKSWTKSQHEHDEPMAFQRARAFSVKSENRNQKSEIEDSGARGQDPGTSRQKTEVSSQDTVCEEGRGKNEEINDNGEQAVVCSQQKIDNGDQGADGSQQASQTHDSSCQPEVELPEFIKILERVTMRSRLQNLDYLGFTEEEMRQLNADPGFAEFQPEMAAEIRRALEEHDSG